MCADFLNLKEELDILVRNGVDYLHIDITDGHYVPNFTLGIDFCETVLSYTGLPLDIHLMVGNPESIAELFARLGNVLVSFHPEVCYQPLKLIDQIRELGARPGVDIAPAVTLESSWYLFPEVDLVNIMTVNPGYSGQKIIPGTLEKLKGASRLFKDKNFQAQIEVDGNVSWQNLPRMLRAGAQVFVAGTSSIFNREVEIEKNVQRFRSVLDSFIF